MLTKDADYFISCIYKEYLSRIKNNTSKSQAIYFKKDEINNLVPKINSSDIDEIKMELVSNKLLEKNILGDISLTKDSIIYMENRFKKGLNDVIDFITKFIP